MDFSGYGALPGQSSEEQQYLAAAAAAAAAASSNTQLGLSGSVLAGRTAGGGLGSPPMSLGVHGHSHSPHSAAAAASLYPGLASAPGRFSGGVSAAAAAGLGSPLGAYQYGGAAAAFPHASPPQGTQGLDPAMHRQLLLQMQQRQSALGGTAGLIHPAVAGAGAGRGRGPAEPSPEQDEPDPYDEKIYVVDHTYTDYASIPPAEVLKDYVEPSNTGGITQPFPQRLHALLMEPSLYDPKVISWQPHGRCFIIHQPKTFGETTMVTHFKHRYFTSFQRQLNLYGFKRITTGPDKGAYYHELFLRGRPYLCLKIKRAKNKGLGKKPLPDPDNEPNFYKMSYVTGDFEQEKKEGTLPQGFDQVDSLLADIKKKSKRTGIVYKTGQSYAEAEKAALLTTDGTFSSILHGKAAKMTGPKPGSKRKTSKKAEKVSGSVKVVQSIPKRWVKTHDGTLHSPVGTVNRSVASSLAGTSPPPSAGGSDAQLQHMLRMRQQVQQQLQAQQQMQAQAQIQEQQLQMQMARSAGLLGGASGAASLLPPSLKSVASGGSLPLGSSAASLNPAASVHTAVLDLHQQQMAQLQGERLNIERQMIATSRAAERARAAAAAAQMQADLTAQNNNLWDQLAIKQMADARNAKLAEIAEKQDAAAILDSPGKVEAAVVSTPAMKALLARQQQELLDQINLDKEKAEEELAQKAGMSHVIMIDKEETKKAALAAAAAVPTSPPVQISVPAPTAAPEPTEKKPEANPAVEQMPPPPSYEQAMDMKEDSLIAKKQEEEAAAAAAAQEREEAPAGKTKAVLVSAESTNEPAGSPSSADAMSHQMDAVSIHDTDSTKTDDDADGEGDRKAKRKRGIRFRRLSDHSGGGNDAASAGGVSQTSSTSPEKKKGRFASLMNKFKGSGKEKSADKDDNDKEMPAAIDVGNAEDHRMDDSVTTGTDDSKKKSSPSSEA